MIYATSMIIGPSANRQRYYLPQADDEAVRILAIYLTVVADSSIVTGEYGLWALSVHEFPASDIPSGALEFHQIRNTEGSPNITRVRAGRFFITGSINGQNNPGLYNYIFRNGIEYAGDLFAYTNKADGAGASLICAITIEYELFKVDSRRRKWLHNNVA